MATTIDDLPRTAAATGGKPLFAAAQPHPYLSGLHVPLAREVTVTDLKVTGTIPAALDGRYLRIGPNPVSPPDPAKYHWFVGDGMVHGVRLSGGSAQWYRNRWVRSKAVSAALGEPEAPGPRNGMSDTANTNVLGHAGRTWALVEAVGFPVEMSDTLDTVAHNPFDGTLKGTFSAHPHLDPLTGELHAICYAGTDPTTIRHVVVNADGKVVREEPVAVQDGPSIHDCMITQRYALIFDLPLTFSMKTLLAGHAFPYAWNPDHAARVGLLPRDGKGSDTIWCAVSPCHVFHPCNAYDTPDGKVIVDLAVHDRMFAESTQGPDSQTVTFERWTIDPVARTVDRHVIDTDPQEFPRPDERRTGQPYRYAYTMPLPRGTSDFVSEPHYYKHDLVAGTRETHEFGAGRYPGEFVFVPRTPDAAEDDGWLLGYVIDTNDDTTDLVILDAAHFTAPPVATVKIPHRVPPGFHGNWVPAA